MSTQVAFAATARHKRYITRGKNQLHTIFEKHFSEFCDQYDERFAQKYGSVGMSPSTSFVKMSA